MNVLRAAAAAVALAVMPASAAIYNAWDDFSIAANPNGVWSYGYGTPGSSFTALPATIAQHQPGYDTPGWYSPGAPFGVPLIYANNSGQTIISGSTTILPSALYAHPGNSGALAAILRFIAPEQASYDILAGFSAASVGTTGASLWLNGALLGAHETVSAATPVSKHHVVTLAAGAVLDFAIDFDGSFLNDSTRFSVAITSSPVTPPDPPTGVPEPASLALLAMGLGCLGFLRRRDA